MKKKKFKKLTDKIDKISRDVLSINSYEKKAAKVEKWADYDSNVSQKFKKLITNLMEYPENLDIDIYENRIRICVDDIKRIKNSSYSVGSSLKSSSNDELVIEISKEGFEVYLEYRKSSRYKDENIFDELYEIIIGRLQEINKVNFDEIWQIISKESGILRDSNLEELFN